MLGMIFYTAGPVLAICLFLCFTPFWLFPSSWKDPSISDPINIALNSLSYRYALVAVISASISPLMELSFECIASHGNSNTRSLYTLCLLLTFVIPELLILFISLPFSSPKLHMAFFSARLMIAMFSTALFLCRFGQTFWRRKRFIIAVSSMFIGSTTISLSPYFSNNLSVIIEQLGLLFQFCGSMTVLHLCFQYLRNKSTRETSDNNMIADEAYCQFASLCLSFVICGLFLLYFAAGMPHWTNFDTVYLTIYTILFSVPIITMCAAFSRAFRNEAYFLQTVKQTFVRYISHEMRTPLNTATLGLQYLRNELSKTPATAELVDVLDEVRAACEISVTILNEMLDYDKLQSGGMKLELEEVAVRDFLETTISTFHVQARQKDIQLTCELRQASLDYLYIAADRNKLAQVIRNLLSNALKFTPPRGSVQVIATVDFNSIGNSRRSNESSLTTSNVTLKVDVIDSGVGVSKENQKKMFVEIVQFNPGKLQSGGGSGLGLYISKGIMDLHKGCLSITSDGEGHGCTFTATLSAKYKYTTSAAAGTSSPHSAKNRYRSSHTPPQLPPAEHKNSFERERGGGSGSGGGSPYFNSTVSRLVNPCRWNQLLSQQFMCLYKGKEKGKGRTAIAGGTTGTTRRSLISSKIFPTTTNTATHKAAAVVIRKGSSIGGGGGGIGGHYRGSGGGWVGDSNGNGPSYECQSFSETLDPLPPLFKVLVVDDSTSNRKMLARLLRDKCAVIVEAEDGVQAVSRIKESLDAQTQTRGARAGGGRSSTGSTSSGVNEEVVVFDAVLMDYVMPLLEGPEAARCMRQLGYRGVIIGITGNALPSDRDRFTGHGADLVLQKPVNIREVNDALRLINRTFH